MISELFLLLPPTDTGRHNLIPCKLFFFRIHTVILMIEGCLFGLFVLAMLCDQVCLPCNQFCSTKCFNPGSVTNPFFLDILSSLKMSSFVIFFYGYTLIFILYQLPVPVFHSKLLSVTVIL